MNRLIGKTAVITGGATRHSRPTARAVPPSGERLRGILVRLETDGQKDDSASELRQAAVDSELAGGHEAAVRRREEGSQTIVDVTDALGVPPV
jgi:hypothetical protein